MDMEMEMKYHEGGGDARQIQIAAKLLVAVKFKLEAKIENN
jgi:hypothetical protein